jgi:glutaredoxin
MDPLSKRVLEAYDLVGREALELSALAEFALSPGKGAEADPSEGLARRAAPAGGDAVRAVVAEMVERGWLRPVSAPNLFARTEDGRLALAGPRDVTLYTRPGCRLCEEAKAQMAPLLREFGATLREINIDADALLRERYTNDVPVIFLGARKVAKHRVDLPRFRRQLAAAADSA